MAFAKKRRFNQQPKTTTETKQRTKKPVVDLAARDEHLDSDSDNNNNDNDDAILQRNDVDDDSEQEDLETKRVRLAREYLDRIDQVDDSSESGGDEVSDDDDDKVGRKLQKQRLKSLGAWQSQVADQVASDLLKLSTPTDASVKSTDPRLSMQQWVDAGHVHTWKGHDLTVTSVDMSQDGTRAVSGSKDHSVLLWDVETEKSINTLSLPWKKAGPNVDRTAGQVCAVACSDDKRFAAVGARDALVRIYDLRQSKALVNTFKGHRGPVTSLCFRPNSLQLFSASSDRTIRHYNIQEMMYLETLFGHQSEVQCVACPNGVEQPVSVGRDRTARLWKLAQDSHLIFRGGAKLPAANSVAVPRDGWFVTGHEDSTVCLWKIDKKKAIMTIPRAHDGPDGVGIVNVQCLPGSDLTLTGSNDGFLRLWKVQTGNKREERGMDLIGQVPLHGYINGIAMGPKARFCLVAMGQEHRLGRWSPVSKAKNRLALVQLRSESDEAEADNGNDDSSDENVPQDDVDSDSE